MSDLEPNPQTANTFSIIAIVLGGLAFIVLPIFIGPAAIILAVIAKNKKEKYANLALTIGILGTVLGMILGAIIGAAYL